MPNPKRVAIIGAGSSGLTAIKACKEENIEPVCYERNSQPGGLWRYHDEDIEGVASVMKTTVINTSKEISAFSDFPPPADFPNFMHHSYMYKYFLMYAEKFDLLKHIQFNSELVKIEQAENYSVTGKWIVVAKNTHTGELREEIFDGVMVCTGHHVFPKIPRFEGQEKFRGEIIHTHSLKNCEGFSGKNVVVVGIGNSAVDAAVDSTFSAKQVYLSTRRGSWIRARLGSNGYPYDFDITRSQQLLASFSSYETVCTNLENEVNKKFDHELYNLKPKHRIFAAHPTLNDAIPTTIITGRVKVKGDILRFEENGIVFENDNGALTEVDVVILATGYEIKFPFVKDVIISTKENKINLYKYAIPPLLKHKTMIFIGVVQPLGPIFPVAEMQSRWFIQILTKKIQLPTQGEIEADIKCKTEANAKRYVKSTRHTVQVDFMPFLDELAEQMGAKPNYLTMAFTDPELFYVCMFGPVFPYQYRLVGPHAWKGARDAILKYKERAEKPFKPKQLQSKSSKSCNSSQVETYKSLLLNLYMYIALVAILIYDKAFPNRKRAL